MRVTKANVLGMYSLPVLLVVGLSLATDSTALDTNIGPQVVPGTGTDVADPGGDGHGLETVYFRARAFDNTGPSTTAPGTDGLAGTDALSGDKDNGDGIMATYDIAPVTSPVLVASANADHRVVPGTDTLSGTDMPDYNGVGDGLEFVDITAVMCLTPTWATLASSMRDMRAKS